MANTEQSTDRGGVVPHMSADQFRALGARMLETITGYWEGLDAGDGAGGGRLPVMCDKGPGWVLGQLPERAPEEPGGAGEWDAIFADVEKLIVPALTHWQSPNFYSFFPCNGSYPAILGELLSAGLGVNGMLWATSPAATELETRLLDWMAKAMGLSDEFLSTSANGGGCIQATASESTLAALLAARQRARAKGAEEEEGNSPRRATEGHGGRQGWGEEKGRGRGAPEYVVYASTQAHSSVAKAAMIAGIAEGPEDPHIWLVPVDASGAMREDELVRMVREDVTAGRVPLMVCATVGTTGITAIDRVDRIAAALESVPGWRGADGSARGWLHVDAAHAGALWLCEEFAHLRAGLERVDSICFNPHKWMLTTFDCDLFWTRDRRSLVTSMSINPAYLKNEASESGAVFDYRDWHVPLGRRFRALKLWFVLRHYGLEGIRAYLREHVRLAALLERWVAEDGAFELCAARTMNLVVFRPRGKAGEDEAAQDARTKDLMDAVNRGGRLFVSPVVLPREWKGTERDQLAGRLAIRMCVGATLVEERHVHGAWEEIRRVAREVTN
ncbi:MAG: hypothetical protein KF902_00765 [Phycisphaeraceae bacterium]|nr:hypothetical protein [Phycisphaeraceae bacterium]